MVTTRSRKKNLTAAARAERIEFSEREKRTKQFVVEKAQRAIAVRSKDREFHGLEREFQNFHADMLTVYEQSKDVKHPRDVGNVREKILKNFLLNSGLLPRRYGVSATSARVVSTTGHTSNEIDILFYDPLDSVSLMKRDDVFEVFPVESVYGVIQVKSKLGKTEIKEGLENISSFKRLNRISNYKPKISFGGALPSESGFGILFAYDSDLDWMDIYEEIKIYAEQNPNRIWSNAIFVLNKGFFVHGGGVSAHFKNEEIERIQDLQVCGFPDRENQCLYQFYRTLVNLLRSTSIQPTPIENYFRLPLISGEHSYEFAFGSFAEVSKCEKHGDYQRKIPEDKLLNLIEWCRNTKPVNLVQALDVAYGKAADNSEAYARQPEEVRVYNPDNLPFSAILVRDEESKLMEDGKTIVYKGLAFDTVRSAGLTMLIPFYYQANQQIISGCQKCYKSSMKTTSVE